MAEPQFEQFQKIFDELPQHIKASTQCYRLIHDLTPESNLPEYSPTSVISNEDLYNLEYSTECQIQRTCHSNCSKNYLNFNSNVTQHHSNQNCLNRNYLHVPSDLTGSPKLPGIYHLCSSINRAPCESLDFFNSIMCKKNNYSFESSDEDDDDSNRSLRIKQLRLPPPDLLPVRPRRRLPEIPKHKKPLDPSLLILRSIPSLAEELYAASEKKRKSHAADDISPEDMKLRGLDVDSGASTAHSPANPASLSSSPTSSGISTLELLEKTCRQLEPTHNALHKFIPRHSDELELEIGDPIYVQKEADDLWCEGVNLRTFKCGIFPCAHIVDVEYADFDPELIKIRKERFLLDYLGSVKVFQHKGNEVLCQAIRKIVRLQDSMNSSTLAFPIILEIGEQGIRMLDRNKPPANHIMTYDYFYNLKNVSFCGYHPQDQRYFGFITKHPVKDSFACHVFKSEQTARDATDAVGRAFYRFYNKFMETAFPVEDIYIE